VLSKFQRQNAYVVLARRIRHYYIQPNPQIVRLYLDDDAASAVLAKLFRKAARPNLSHASSKNARNPYPPIRNARLCFSHAARQVLAKKQFQSTRCTANRIRQWPFRNNTKRST
jgi:hypothetical protein